MTVAVLDKPDAIAPLQAAVAAGEVRVGELEAEKRVLLAGGVSAAARAKAAEISDARAGLDLANEALSMARDKIAAEQARQRAAVIAAKKQRATGFRSAALARFPVLEEKLGAAAVEALALIGDVNSMRAEMGLTAIATGPLAGDNGDMTRALIAVMVERAFVHIESRGGRGGVSPPENWNPAGYAQAVCEELKPGWIAERIVAEAERGAA